MEVELDALADANADAPVPVAPILVTISLIADKSQSISGILTSGVSHGTAVLVSPPVVCAHATACVEIFAAGCSILITLGAHG